MAVPGRIGIDQSLRIEDLQAYINHPDARFSDIATEFQQPDHNPVHGWPNQSFFEEIVDGADLQALRGADPTIDTDFKLLFYDTQRLNFSKFVDQRRLLKAFKSTREGNAEAALLIQRLNPEAALLGVLVCILGAWFSRPGTELAAAPLSFGEFRRLFPAIAGEKLALWKEWLEPFLFARPVTDQTTLDDYAADIALLTGFLVAMAKPVADDLPEAETQELAAAIAAWTIQTDPGPFCAMLRLAILAVSDILSDPEINIADSEAIFAPLFGRVQLLLDLMKKYKIHCPEEQKLLRELLE